MSLRPTPLTPCHRMCSASVTGAPVAPHLSWVEVGLSPPDAMGGTSHALPRGSKVCVGPDAGLDLSDRQRSECVWHVGDVWYGMQACLSFRPGCMTRHLKDRFARPHHTHRCLMVLGLLVHVHLAAHLDEPQHMWCTKKTCALSPSYKTSFKSVRLATLTILLY